MLERNGKAIAGKTVVVSGSGNVAIYAVQKRLPQLGAKVVAMCDSNGYIYDPDGIELDVVKQLKEVERKRIKEYVEACSDRDLHRGLLAASGRSPATLPCPAQRRTKSTKNPPRR